MTQLGYPTFDVRKAAEYGAMISRPRRRFLNQDEGDATTLAPSQPAQEFNVGPSIDLANAGDAGTAVKVPGQSGWHGWQLDALRGFQRGGLAGAGVNVLLSHFLKKQRPGFADGGDLTPYLGRRVRLGERGPELVVDEKGNVQPVGLHGEETAIPTRPAVVIPHEQLSDAGHELIAGLLSKGRKADTLPGPRFSAAAAAAYGASGSPAPSGPVFSAQRANDYLTSEAHRNTPGSTSSLPLDRTPSGDERLTGSGGAELGERPKFDAAAVADFNRLYNLGTPGAEPAGYSSAVPPYSKGPAQQRLDELLAQRPTDKNGRLRSGLKMLALGPVQPTNSLGYGLGQLGDHFLYGLFNKSADEELQRRREIPRASAAAAVEAADQKRQLDWEEARSQINLRNAQTDYYNTTKPEETRQRAQDRAQRALLAQLQKKPTVDPVNDSVFMDRWQKNFGEPFDYQSWNNRKSNVVRYTRTDPDHPERTQLVERNVSTGDETILGQRGFQATRNDEGMTGAEVHADSDRDRAFTAGEKQRGITNNFRRQTLDLSRGRFALAEAAQDNRFSEQDRKRYDAASKLAAQAEAYQQTAETLNSHDKYIDPDTKEEKTSSRRDIDRDKWAARAQAARRQLFQSYPDLFEQGSDGRVRMTQSEYRSMFPSLGGGYVGDAQSLGVDLYDADKTGQGTPVRSPMHRVPSRTTVPSRPAASAPAAAPAQSKGRVSRKNFDKVRAQNPSLQGKSDAEVEAALRAQGIEVY